MREPRSPGACLLRDSGNKYQIGTSGFMVSRAQWLSLSCLNCIEINSTFYALPSAKVVENWKALPERVSFVMKASKYITHIKRLKDVEEAWTKFYTSIRPLGRRLRAVLIQLPPSYAFSSENLGRIVAMHRYVPEDLPIAVEFRHDSWFQDATYAAFRTMRWCICGTYVQKRKGAMWMGTMPAGLNLPPKTASFNYLRVHGARGYKGALGREQLESLQDALRKQRTRETYVMFNNTFFDPRSRSCTINGMRIKYAAVCNAVEFTDVIVS
jgi:uncharacterized protein YecE (DUF72 family)